MRKIEEVLYTESNIIENITIPQKLDERLNSLKYRQTPQLNLKKLCITCATAILVTVIFTITAVGVRNADFVGFDSVTVDTVAEAIHRENAFQARDISHTFKDGTTVTVDGCVVDSDRIMIFGTISKEAELTFNLLNSRNEPFLSSGDGSIDFSTQKYSHSFNIKPSKLKNCRIQIQLGDESKIFNLAPDTTVAKKRFYKINQQFEYENTIIKLKSIQTNITSCILEYEILLPSELRAQSGFFDNTPEIHVQADGKNLDPLSGSFNSAISLSKLKFNGTERFEPLPPQTQKVSILIENIPVLKEEPVKLTARVGAKAANGSSEFEILDIKKENGKNMVTLSGNCLFFKDNVTAQSNSTSVLGNRINWELNEKNYGYTHYYQFDGEIDSITIGKYICNVTVNKKIELK